ncbi:hypothetical protein [Planotetraspora sp. GP83]|uniref:hypothetical protein n=1 Tax=Planotetraspora sp. GP83 TaxID=3156264 RepID=UPI003515181A
MSDSAVVADRATPSPGAGHVPRRRKLIILFSGLAGFLLTVIWSAEFVDQTIGDNVAGTLLGHDAKGTPIAGVAAGIVFAFVSGIAGTFTACDIAVFGAVLIGGFLIGRPFALFRQMFRDAAERGNRLYGAAAFVMQSVGNIVIMAVRFIVLAAVGCSRLQRWLSAKPGRAAVLTASALIIAGVFTFLYWDVRTLARREIIPWYAAAPWS